MALMAICKLSQLSSVITGGVDYKLSQLSSVFTGGVDCKQYYLSLVLVIMVLIANCLNSL